MKVCRSLLSTHRLRKKTNTLSSTRKNTINQIDGFFQPYFFFIQVFHHHNRGKTSYSKDSPHITLLWKDENYPKSIAKYWITFHNCHFWSNTISIPSERQMQRNTQNANNKHKKCHHFFGRYSFPSGISHSGIQMCTHKKGIFGCFMGGRAQQCESIRMERLED